MTVLEKKVEKKKEETLYNVGLHETDESDSIIELIDYELPQSSAKLNISITRPDITKIRGVGPSVAEKLREAGFNSIEHIARSSVAQLSSIRGIGQATAEKIVEGARSLLHRKNLNDFPERSQPSASTPRPSTTPIQEVAPIVVEPEIVLEDIEEYEDFEVYEEEPPTLLKESLYEPEPPQEVPLSPRREISLKTTNEKMSREEKREILSIVASKVQGLGYTIMKTVPQLKKIYSLVDLIAFKVISHNELMDLIVIVPIKISTLKGQLQISNEMIKYLPHDQNASDGSIYKTLLDSCFKQLEQCQALLYQELRQEGHFTSYLKRFHNVDIGLRKTTLKRNLSFDSGNLQIKIVVEPILLCENEIGFLEKIIPFAYLKDVNLHIIHTSRISDLLGFLEQKYRLLETHNTKDTSLVSYEGAKNQLLRRIEFLSVPFIGFAGVLILMLALKSFEILALLSNFGYAFFGIYVIALFYFNMRFFKYKTELQQEFTTPYHKRKLTFDETSLVLINEEFTPEMMTQFVFESIGKNNNSKIVTQIEERQIRERVDRSRFESKVENEAFFEKEEKEEPRNGFEAKYRSFLED